MFEAGYKERVDFEKEIGVYVFPTGIRESTSFGVIHYHGDERYHVVPARPDSLEEDRSLGTLLISCQRALIGEVIPSLRGVIARSHTDYVEMIFYHDGLLNERIKNEYYCIGTEVSADFKKAKMVERVIRWDAPKPIPKHEEGLLIYRRKEPFITPYQTFMSRLLYRIKCLRQKCRSRPK